MSVVCTEIEVGFEDFFPVKKKKFLSMPSFEREVKQICGM
jgi:hypothetical protein